MPASFLIFPIIVAFASTLNLATIAALAITSALGCYYLIQYLVVAYSMATTGNHNQSDKPCYSANPPIT